MAIDLEREPLITLATASKLIPGRKGQKKVSDTVLWRWIVHGKRGLRLEGYRTPAGWVTSVAAVQRFLAGLARQDRERLCGRHINDTREPEPLPGPVEGVAAMPEGNEAYEKAMEECRAMGVKC